MSNKPLTTQEKRENAGETPEVFQMRVSESKRTALLRYLIIMFAVAFVLVLLSMVVHVRSSNATMSEMSKTSTSAMANAQRLQDDNLALRDRVAALEQELTGVTAALEEYSAANNALRAENADLKASEAKLRATCDDLAKAVMAAAEPDEAAVTALENMKQYLSSEVAEDYEKWLKNKQ